MAWVMDTSGRWAKTGNQREFLDTGVPLPALARIEVPQNNYQHFVRVLVLGSRDGASGWEVGIAADSGASPLEVMVRRVVYGVPEAPVATAAHGLATGQPFTLRVDYGVEAADRFTVSIVTGESAVVTLTYDNTASPTYSTFKAFGPVSEVDGAVILPGFRVVEINKTPGSVSDVLVAVGGGDLWASFDGGGLSLLQSRALGATGHVSFAFLAGTAYLVGGGKAVTFNPVTRAVAAYTPTLGSLPGQTGPGTTDCGVVAAWGRRLVFSRSRSQPHRVYVTAIDRPTDLDTASIDFGPAFVLNMQEPVAAIAAIGEGALLIACERTTYLLTGDPGRGASDLSPIPLSTGASGPSSILVSGGLGAPLVHSHAGVYLAFRDGARHLSQPVVRSGVNTDETFTVSMVRDRGAGRVHLYRTAPSGTPIHAVYEESAGGYAPGTGGFFQDTYPASIGPSCCTEYRGVVHVGGKDGRIYRLSAMASSDDGAAIDAACPLRLLNTGRVDGGIELQRLSVLAGLVSSPITVRIYSAPTPEEVYDDSRRTLRGSRVVSYLSAPITQKVSDGAVLAELSGEGRWFCEAADAIAVPTSRIYRARKAATLAAPDPCAVASPVTTTPPVEGGGGAGTPPLPGSPPAPPPPPPQNPDPDPTDTNPPDPNVDIWLVPALAARGGGWNNIPWNPDDPTGVFSGNPDHLDPGDGSIDED